MANAAIRELIQAYNASTATELDLAGRIVGFSVAAMDNLRLSMKPGLSDTLVLRYRCNAVTLSRSADQARMMLEALPAGRPACRDVPRPSVAPAPKVTEAVKPPALTATTAAKPPASTATTAAKSPAADSAGFPQDIEAMKREARIMLAGFSRNGLHGSAIPLIPDPVALAGAAARDAVTRALRPPGG